MLYDRPIRDVQGDLARKWMTDDALELVIWYRNRTEMAGFELIYDRTEDAHALRWSDETGYAHFRIDMGEEVAGCDRTPVLLPGGVFPKERVLELFTRRGATLPSALYEFLLAGIRNYQ